MEWKFKVLDLVCTKIGVYETIQMNELCVRAGNPVRLRFPSGGNVIARKYEKCHGGCIQLSYVVESDGVRREFAEGSLVDYRVAWEQCTPSINAVMELGNQTK